jgi:hypothetical protein
MNLNSRKLKKTEAVDKTGKLWSKEDIQNLLEKNDEAVYKAMLRIYDRQTRDEQDAKDTQVWNSVGFTGTDAEIMSSFTESYKKWGKLTPKQMVIARKKMKKYWKQLLEIIREENPNRQPERVGIN